MSENAPKFVPHEFVAGTTEMYKQWEYGLKQYEDILGVSKEFFNGKTVLDLGSGATEKFTRELKASGINATVVHVNPDLANPVSRHTLNTTPGREGHLTVAAVANKLPFKDESFDAITAVRSVLTYARLSSAGFRNIPGRQLIIMDWVKEMARVLKPNGVALLAPAFCSAEDVEKDMDYKFISDEFKKLGLEVTFENLENKKVKELHPEHKFASWSRMIVKKTEHKKRTQKLLYKSKNK